MSPVDTSLDQRAEFPGFTAPWLVAAASADGAFVTRVDGVQVVDYAQRFGSCLFGHGAVLAEMSRLWPNARELSGSLGDLQSHTLRDQASRELASRVAGEAHINGWHVEGELRSLILHSGSEAVETALKTALLARAGRSTVVAFEGAYHGTFGLALAVTHGERFREPFNAALAADFVRFERYGVVPTLDESIAAVIVEPIQGRSGVIVPPAGFLSGLRAECDRVGALLILDDVLVGMGRVAGIAPGIEARPDIVCLGKALGGGVAAAAIVATSDVARVWKSDTEPIHTSTHVGDPVSAAAVLATCTLIDGSDMAHLQARAAATMRALGERHGFATRVYGALGIMETDEPGAGVAWCAEHADELLAVPCGAHGESVALYPALIEYPAL